MKWAALGILNDTGLEPKSYEKAEDRGMVDELAGGGCRTASVGPSAVKVVAAAREDSHSPEDSEKAPREDFGLETTYRRMIGNSQVW